MAMVTQHLLVDEQGRRSCLRVDSRQECEPFRVDSAVEPRPLVHGMAVRILKAGNLGVPWFPAIASVPAWKQPPVDPLTNSQRSRTVMHRAQLPRSLFTCSGLV